MKSMTWLPAACGLFFCAMTIFGQAQSGTVVGTVTDQAGSVVPDANVTIVNDGTQFNRTVTTNAQGQYSANAFPTGFLTITVEREGFAKLVRSGVELTAADTITVNLQLMVGDVKQSVEVTSAAPLLQSQSAAVSQLIDNRQVLELPLNGRQFTSLITLAPGAYAGSAGNLAGAVYALRGNTNYSVNGSQADNNAYLIDGLVNAGLWLNNMVIVPTPDSIQELRAMTSNYSAEYGSSAGMVTIVQTKSGTNDLHGSGYEFLQNADMNANNFFSNLNKLSRVGQRRNEFGGTLGGPIRKNKTFAFGDYQGLRIATPITTYSALIPTPAVAQMIETGNFAGFTTANGTPVTLYNPYNVVNGQRVPFSGNAIPAALIDPAVKKLTSLLPAPNVSGNPATNFAVSPSTTQRSDQFDIRVDHNLRDADRLFFKYSYDNSILTNPGMFPAPANPGFQTAPYVGGNAQYYFTTYKNWSAGANYTKVIGANIVNELRVGAIRWNHELTPLDTPYKVADAVGIPGININPFAGGLPGFSIAGQNWFLGQNSFFPETNRELTYQFEDVATIVRGSHTFKIGARFLRQSLNGYSAYPARGQYNFNGQFTSQIGVSNTTATALADWALGAPNAVTRNVLNGTFGMRFWNLAGFADDTWRITNRLTVNLGLRYEIQAPPVEVANRWSNFNVVTGQLLAAGQGGNSRSLRALDDNNFSPRVGIAYTVGSSEKTVIRSGFGVSYAEAYNVGQQLYKNAPNFLSQSYSAAANQTPGLVVSQGLPVPVPPPVVNGVVQISPGTLPYAWDFNMVTPKALQWSFSVQRELKKDLLLDVAYVGTRGIDLMSNVNINQAFPGSGPVDPRRPLYALQPNVQQVQFWSNWGASKYHSLQVKLQQRYWHGLSAQLAYTFSKNMADAEGANQSNNPIQNARCYACEWSTALENRAHVVAINHTYELPFGPRRSFLNHGALGYIVGNWDISGIWSAQTGNYFSPLMASAVSNTGANVNGGTYDRPNLSRNPNLPADQQSIYRWFDTGAFSAPAAGTFGNSARNVLVGPGIFNFDAGLHRVFSIGERWRMQFRAEAFNTLNRANFTTPGAGSAPTTLGSPNFGRILAAAPARILQISLKLNF